MNLGPRLALGRRHGMRPQPWYGRAALPTLCALLLLSVRARAQGVGGEPPAPAAAPAGPPASAATAPPAPNALAPALGISTPGQPKTNVERARERSEVAQLTPLVPSPNDVSRTAFQLYAEVDIPVTATSLVLASARLLRTQAPDCPGFSVSHQCDPAGLNSFDRHFAGTWRPGWGTFSDLGLVTMTVGAGAFLLVDEGALPALNDAVVVAESAFVATALPSMTTLATSRPRPFVYGDRAPDSERTKPSAALSFISSHSSVGFAVATSTFIAAKRLHPQSSLPWWVLGVGLAGATSVATARVLAGQHFPTDAGAGAIIGASVGIAVPSLHGLPLQVTHETRQGGGVVGLSGAF